MKKENLHAPNCIRTHTGKYIDVFNLNIEDIDIKDIAHALSQVPRFGGHLPRFFSVAQHSINCTKITKNNKLEALLHDASEAYILDMPKPIKNRLPDYCKLEKYIMGKIFTKFDLNYPISKEVKKKDVTCLQFEWDMIMISNNEDYECWNSIKAEWMFMKAFNEITKDKA